MYLDGKLRNTTLDNGIKMWLFLSSQYVQVVVNNVANYLKGKVKKFPSRPETPLGSNYQPEINITPELQPVDVAYY